MRTAQPPSLTSHDPGGAQESCYVHVRDVCPARVHIGNMCINVHTMCLCWVLFMPALDLGPPIWSKAQSVKFSSKETLCTELNVSSVYLEVLGFKRLEATTRQSLRDMAT